MYEVLEDKGIKTLYRIKKDGGRALIAQVLNTIDGKVFIVDSLKLRSYNFKSGERIKFKKSGNNFIAAVKEDIAVYKYPHVSTFHREYILQNARAQWRGDSSADSNILSEGMQEYIGTL